MLKKLLLFRHILEIFDFFVNKESINVNGAIKAISNLFIFFYGKVLHTQKVQKAEKAQRRKKAKKELFSP